MPDYKVIFTQTVDYEVYFTTEEPLTLQQVTEEQAPDWFELMDAFRPEWRRDVKNVDNREISILKELLPDRTERLLVNCGYIEDAQFPEEEA